ncbi:MAG: flagellar protein FlaG [Blautia sp.]|nr:flagellar protein FlaG [Blautia sp.]MCM1200186.1 flagellar protein FlaG [Bacteroides fragilis]
MALEPLNSVMTFQAQDVVKPKVQPVQPVDMEVLPEDQAGRVDATTASVVKTQPEDSEQGGGNGRDANGNPRQQGLNSQQSASEPLKKAIAEMNRRINSKEEAVFGVHEDTNRITIKIVNKDTKEVVKEFPPEKTLDMIAKVWEIAGILVDEKR